MWRDDFSVLWKWHKSKRLPSCLRMLLYLDHDASSCRRHLVSIRRLCWDLAKAWRRQRHCVCGVEEVPFSVIICFLGLELIMGLPLLAAEHLSKAVLKIQPRFISSRVSTTWWCLLLVQGFVSLFQIQSILLRPWEVPFCNVLSHILWPYASKCPETLMPDQVKLNQGNPDEIIGCFQLDPPLNKPILVLYSLGL